MSRDSQIWVGSTSPRAHPYSVLTLTNLKANKLSNRTALGHRRRFHQHGFQHPPLKNPSPPTRWKQNQQVRRGSPTAVRKDAKSVLAQGDETSSANRATRSQPTSHHHHQNSPRQNIHRGRASTPGPDPDLRHIKTLFDTLYPAITNPNPANPLQQYPLP